MAALVRTDAESTLSMTAAECYQSSATGRRKERTWQEVTGRPLGPGPAPTASPGRWSGRRIWPARFRASRGRDDHVRALGAALRHPESSFDALQRRDLFAQRTPTACSRHGLRARSCTGGNAMKVLGIWGSPRRGGNSEVLLKAFLDGAAEGGAQVERIALRELRITPCLEIQHCLKDGTCPIKDDMVEVYERLLSADVVALSSPIFFYGVSAQMKSMIDRCQALWARRWILRQERPLPKSQGVLLCTAASHGKLLFAGARLTAKYFFEAMDATFAAEILVQGVDGKGAILEMPEVLTHAADLGRRMARGQDVGVVSLSPLEGQDS